MRKRLALLALVPFLAACSVSRGYDAEPVKSATNHREIDIPDLNNEKAQDAVDCWRVEIWSEGWFGGGQTKNVGIACLVEEDR